MPFFLMLCGLLRCYQLRISQKAKSNPEMRQKYDIYLSRELGRDTLSIYLPVYDKKNANCVNYLTIFCTPT